MATNIAGQVVEVKACYCGDADRRHGVRSRDPTNANGARISLSYRSAFITKQLGDCPTKAINAFFKAAGLDWTLGQGYTMR